MKETLAIVDFDKRFGEALAAALNERDFDLQAVYLSPADDVDVITGDSISVVLLDESLPADQQKKFSEKKILYFSSLPGYEKCGGVPVVFKYQPIFETEKAILNALKETEENPALQPGKTGCRFVGIATPADHSYKTEFAFVLGQLLSQRVKTLLISFDVFSGYESRFQRPFPATLSDLLYCYEGGEKCDGVEAEELLQHFHGLDFIPPVSAPDDLWETSPENVFRTLEKFASENDYGFVLLDFGMEWRFLKYGLNSFQKLYVPEGHGIYDEEKMKRFTEWVEGICESSKAPEIEKVRVPGQEVLRIGKNYMETLLWSPTGDYVRSLLNGMS